MVTAVRGVDRQPGADADAHRGMVAQLVLGVTDRVNDTPRDRLGLLVGGVGHDHHEFVTAVARDDVAGAHGRADDGRHVVQHAVAVGVSVAIVDRLEAVEVEHQHSHWAMAAGRPGDLLAQALLQVAVVVDARYQVDVRGTLQLLEQPHAFEAGGRQAGHRLARLHLRIVQAVDCTARVKLDQANGARAGVERQQHHRPGTVVTLVAGHVGRDRGRLDHARPALAQHVATVG